MKKKERAYSDEQISILEQNPYTHSVTPYRLTFTLAFKEFFMSQVHKSGMTCPKILKAAGYDPKNNRIYMVSNSAVLSVPVAKLSKKALKPADVWTTQFDVNREFEDFELDKDGNYYLLVNKYPEIMTQQDLAHWNLTKADFDKYGEYIGPDDYWYDPTQGGDDPTQGGDDPTQNPNGTDDPTQGGDAN